MACYDTPLPLFMAKDEQGRTRELAQVRRIGIVATMVDQPQPQAEILINIKDRQPVNELTFTGGHYTELICKFAFGTYLWTSVCTPLVAPIVSPMATSIAAC